MKIFTKTKEKLPRIRLPSSKKIENIILEFVPLAGFLMLLKGLWDIYPPAMWIIGGLWLMWPGREGK